MGIFTGDEGWAQPPAFYNERRRLSDGIYLAEKQLDLLYEQLKTVEKQIVQWESSHRRKHNASTNQNR